MFPFRNRTGIFTVAVLLVLGVTTGAATVTVINAGPNPIAAASGELTGSTEVSVGSVENVYVGTNVTAVNVTLQDADATSNETVSLHVTLTAADGTVLETVRQTGLVISESSLTVRVDLANSHSVSTVQTVDVVAEETG